MYIGIAGRVQEELWLPKDIRTHPSSRVTGLARDILTGIRGRVDSYGRTGGRTCLV